MNSTVSKLAKSFNMVLTMAYRDIYGDDASSDDPATLTRLTAPLAATEEVINLFSSGLAPMEVALPAALHAIGASKDEIDAAMEKAQKEEEKKCACEDEDRALQTQEKKLSLEERKTALQSAKNEQTTDTSKDSPAETNKKDSPPETKKKSDDA